MSQSMELPAAKAVHGQSYKWLSPLNFAEQQQEHASRATKRSGDWFLTSQSFGNWLNEPGIVLWGSGERKHYKELLLPKG